MDYDFGYNQQPQAQNPYSYGQPQAQPQQQPMGQPPQQPMNPQPQQPMNTGAPIYPPVYGGGQAGYSEQPPTYSGQQPGYGTQEPPLGGPPDLNSSRSPLAEGEDRAKRMMKYRQTFSLTLSIVMMVLMTGCIASMGLTIIFLGFYINLAWVIGSFLILYGIFGIIIDYIDMKARRRKRPSIVHVVDIVAGVLGLSTFPIMWFFSALMR